MAEGTLVLIPFFISWKIRLDILCETEDSLEKKTHHSLKYMLHVI